MYIKCNFFFSSCLGINQHLVRWQKLSVPKTWSWLCEEKVWTARKTHLTTFLFGCAGAWWWLWLLRKWWGFHIDFCGQSQHERSWVLPAPRNHVPHLMPGVSCTLATRLFFQVLQVPLGCQLHASRSVVELGCGDITFPLTHKPTNSHFFLSLFCCLPREHPSGDADAFCGQAGSAAPDVVSAPAAGWKRSSQHPQQRGGNACQLGLGEGLPEAAPAFDRVRMIWWFLCWFSILCHAWLCCTLSLNGVWVLYSILKRQFSYNFAFTVLASSSEGSPEGLGEMQ